MKWRKIQMKVILDILNQLTRVGKIVFAGLILMLIVSLVHSYGKTTQMQSYIKMYEEYQDSVKVVLRVNDSIAKINLARVDSLEKDSILAVQQQRKIRQLMGNIGSTQDEKERLQRELDSLRQIMPDTSEVSLKKDTIIALLREDSTKTQQVLREMFVLDTQRIETINLLKRDNVDLKIRAENAEDKLKKLPQAPVDTDRWFFGLFKKPTRTQSAAIGAAVGLVAGILVAK
jgi:hypothetical protein